jgi:hypothetical protein
VSSIRALWSRLSPRWRLTLSVMAVYEAVFWVIVATGTGLYWYWTVFFWGTLVGIPIGDLLGYGRGRRDERRIWKAILQRGMVEAVVTIEQTIKSVDDDDDRREQAPFN